MLRFYQIADGKLIETLSEEAPVWVFIAPDSTERAGMVHELGIDEHTLNSALDPNELARLEFEDTHAALIIKRPKKYQSEDNFLFKVTSIGLFLFSNRLVCVMADDVPLIEGRKTTVHSLHGVLLRAISISTQHFEEHLRIISMISDDLENKISRSMENRNLLHMFTIEKSLVYYLNAISSNGRVIDKLKAYSAKLGFTEDHFEYLEDIVIENAQCHEQAKVYSQVLSGLMDARASIVRNNLNVIMKTLTLVTIGIMVPNLIVSIFSMNVALPVPDSPLWPFWFIFIMTLCAVSVIALFFIQRAKHW